MAATTMAPVAAAVHAGTIPADRWGGIFDVPIMMIPPRPCPSAVRRGTAGMWPTSYPGATSVKLRHKEDTYMQDQDGSHAS
jgi:hypothetical protein